MGCVRGWHWDALEGSPCLKGVSVARHRAAAAQVVLDTWD